MLPAGLFENRPLGGGVFFGEESADLIFAQSHDATQPPDRCRQKRDTA